MFDTYSLQRERMVTEQIEARGITDQQLLAVMRKVPRHLFVPERNRSQAYSDSALPIGEGQTISQPAIVAIMSELLELNGDEKILEIGTGSGYQTAILAELAGEIITLDRLLALAEKSRSLLNDLGYKNVEVIVGDGTEGYIPRTPYDRILITAGAPYVPQPLLDQLQSPGRLVAPVGTMRKQTLTVVYKDESGNLQWKNHGFCVFVPLVGQHGWDAKTHSSNASDEKR
ncbi:MAG: protein-L-isoaspartate(D-aspartate) O-methyltransferase [bacterium]